MNSVSTSLDLATPVPQIRLYRDWLQETRGIDFATYDELHRWSVEDLEGFWRSIWEWDRIQSPTAVSAVLSGEAMPDMRWFDGATLNYAQHVFSHVDAAEAPGQPAIVALDERGTSETIEWSELRRRAASLALDLRARGIAPGDRVAAYLPNIPAAVIGLLACASVGAVWTLCSPDMGTNAVLDRWRQTQPKALIAVDGVFYAGKALDRSAALAEILAQLPCIETVYLVPSDCAVRTMPDAVDFAAATARDDAAVAGFEPAMLPFDHPLWILYSSGTTGLPKAIVHGHGGVILATAAGRLHFDLGPSYAPNTFGERFHWYSASGWVMWNIQIGGLLSGTTICLFDGSPIVARLGSRSRGPPGSNASALSAALDRPCPRTYNAGAPRSSPHSGVRTSGGAMSAGEPRSPPLSWLAIPNCPTRRAGCNAATSAPLSRRGTNMAIQ